MKEIVIKIPEKWFDDMVREKFTEVDELCAIIQHGTELPKGHGELKDTDKIINDGISKGFCDWYDEIKNAEVLIEADKEYEVEVVTHGNCVMCGKELTEGLFFCKECENKARSGKWEE